jgi:outer membrane protein OmpA-like peptidoglycan-associated protein
MGIKYIRFILGFFTLLVFLTTNSIAGELLHGPTQGQAKTANNPSIIIYREKSNDVQSIPVIFINGKIVASLLPGESVQTRICNSDIKIRVATRGKVVAKGRSKKIHILKNSIIYIKMIKTKNQTFAPLLVNEIQGEKALKDIDRTSNIINRYLPKVTIDKDSLFAFNSAKLLPSARKILDKLVRDINMCPNQVKHIKIIGHADRIGNEKINKKLSKKRAQVVASYLAKHGIKIPLDLEGHGSKEPVTVNCEGKVSPQLIQCLQPDRRVVIEY